jgi:hypothetical protein
MTLILCIFLILLKNKNVVSYSYVTIETNPGIELVVDENNVEYHFHICRAYYADGKPRDIYGVYISIKKGEEIKFIEITNINDL